MTKLKEIIVMEIVIVIILLIWKKIGKSRIMKMIFWEVNVLASLL